MCIEWCKKILKITSFLFLFVLSIDVLGGGIGGDPVDTSPKTITIKPNPAIAQPGQTIQFTTEGGSGTYFYFIEFFYIQDAGSINERSGLYTAPAKIENDFVIRIKSQDIQQNADGSPRITTRDILLQKKVESAECN